MARPGALSIVFLLAVRALAINEEMGTRTLVQPDGTRFPVREYVDEFGHYLVAYPEYTVSDFETMLFGDAYTGERGSPDQEAVYGSMRQYWADMSKGALTSGPTREQKFWVRERNHPASRRPPSGSCPGAF